MIDLMINGLMLVGIAAVGTMTLFFAVVAMVHAVFGCAK